MFSAGIVGSNHHLEKIRLRPFFYCLTIGIFVAGGSWYVRGTGLDEDRVMPKKGRRLANDEIGTLRAWIDQGLKWPDGVTFAAGKLAPLAPRTVALPPNAGANAHPIDALLVPYCDKHRVKAG